MNTAIATLMNEHRVIEQVLGALETFAGAVSRGESGNPAQPSVPDGLRPPLRTALRPGAGSQQPPGEAGERPVSGPQRAAGLGMERRTRPEPAGRPLASPAARRGPGDEALRGPLRNRSLVGSGRLVFVRRFR